MIRPRLRVLAGSGLIALCLLVIYSVALRGGFILDDDRLLTDSRLIRAPDGLFRFWFSAEAMDYWPVTNSSFWLEWRLWGSDSTGYHVTNLALHFLSSLLFWGILARLELPGAFLGALLFAVHPVNVQSVAWIAQRKNTLALVFYLVAIRSFLASESGSSGANSSHPRVFYAVSLVAFVLAMLSKGSVAVLPAVLLGLVAWQRPLTRLDFGRVLPFLFVAVGLTGVNVWFQTHGESVVVRTASLAERFADAGAVVWFYLGKALWPTDLAFVYPGWIIQTRTLASWVPLGLVLVVTGWLCRTRSAAGRAVCAAWTYFCLGLLPVLGFVDVGFMKYALVGDHYQYVAILGVAGLASSAWGVWASRSPGRWWPTLAASVAVAALVLLARRHSESYADPVTLYRTALRANPQCFMAHNNLGLTLARSGQDQEAIRHYEQALSLDPGCSDAWNNLGVLLIRHNRLPSAAEAFEKALRARPRYPEALVNLGGALVRQGQNAQGIVVLGEALKVDPDSTDAHLAMGIALDATDRLSDSLHHLQRAASLSPENEMVLCSMAEVYARMDRGPDAIRTGERALELARAHGRTEIVSGLEIWLARCRSAMGAAAPSDVRGEPGNE